ncbi:hypothetical protein NL676_008045 [Syzygium grande]|nr:hypothetical protein NL676_008045 [Syzygium grande]
MDKDRVGGEIIPGGTMISAPVPLIASLDRTPTPAIAATNRPLATINELGDNRKGDISDEIVSRPTKVIMEIMDKDRVRGEIILEGQRYELPLPNTAFSSVARSLSIDAWPIDLQPPSPSQVRPSMFMRSQPSCFCPISIKMEPDEFVSVI